MAGRTADALLVGDEERAELEALTRATSVSAGVAQRARIVLLAADATPNHQIAELVGVSRPTVNKWRERFAEQRVEGLVDVARPGPMRRIDPRRIVAKTLAEASTSP
jgi:transposase